jgi:hypothetical protein
MIITAILVILAFCALAYISFVAVRGHAPAVTDIAELRGKTEPIDLLAFRNLTDPAEEQYLREQLSSKDFRVVQKQRLRATLAYLEGVSANAAVLLRLGEAVRHSPDPRMADAGLRLVNNAFQVRLYATSAQVRLHMALILPGIAMGRSSVFNSYEQLTKAVSRLGYLQNSTAVQRNAIL